MEIPTCDTHVAVNVAVLHELLDERLNQRGLVPEAPAMDAEGKALLVWLDEVGGDETQVRACRLGGEAAEVSVPMADVFADELDYPLLVFMLRQGNGIPEGTEVTFGG